MQYDDMSTPQYTENSLPERFDSWIKQVLRRLVQNEVRSYKREMKRRNEIFVAKVDDLGTYDPFEDDGEYDRILSASENRIRDKKLAEAFEGITKRQRQVIEGTILLEIPVTVLARKMGLNEKTIHNHMSLGLDELRNILEGTDNE